LSVDGSAGSVYNIITMAAKKISEIEAELAAIRGAHGDLDVVIVEKDAASREGVAEFEPPYIEKREANDGNDKCFISRMNPIDTTY